jgi:hypothetical protein
MIKHYKDLIEYYESRWDYSQTDILKSKISREIDNLKDYKYRKQEEYFWNSVIRKRWKEVNKTEVKPYNKVLCYWKFLDLDKDREEIEKLSESYYESVRQSGI